MTIKLLCLVKWIDLRSTLEGASFSKLMNVTSDVADSVKSSHRLRIQYCQFEQQLRNEWNNPIRILFLWYDKYIQYWYLLTGQAFLNKCTSHTTFHSSFKQNLMFWSNLEK